MSDNEQTVFAEEAQHDASGGDNDKEEKGSDAENEEKKKNLKSKLIKVKNLPTFDEMRAIDHQQELYKTNLFSLQVLPSLFFSPARSYQSLPSLTLWGVFYQTTELLKQVEVDFTATKPLQEYLHALKQEVDKCPEKKVFDHPSSTSHALILLAFTNRFTFSSLADHDRERREGPWPCVSLENCARI